MSAHALGGKATDGARPLDFHVAVGQTKEMQMDAHPGSPGDFDFLVGSWSIANRRLKLRHVGSSDWDEFSSTSRCWRLLDGIVNLDEIDCSARGFKGMTVRTLDRAQRVWSLRWVNSTKGTLEPPVSGGFNDGRGEFYGEDMDESRPVLCRFIWTVDVQSPRWEQAFSTDRGASWETNWIMAFTRKPD